MDMKKYRREFKKDHAAWIKERMKEKEKGEINFEIKRVLVLAPSIDMRSRTRDPAIARDVERFYANDGTPFEPDIKYPPSMLDRFGPEYALNAQGIYYRDEFRPEWVTANRKVWVPSLQSIDWESSSEQSRRWRAEIVLQHNINNERRMRSEYAWEADAWSDVFGHIRDDDLLEIDKHEYLRCFPKTGEVHPLITGQGDLVVRIPDATLALSTFSRGEQTRSIYAKELDREHLEKLLVHPKCGLIADPKWGETDMAFPFAVYEAKGWTGDCREARRQACRAGAVYLDMLDELARKPGPVHSTRPYLMPTSHQYQVFALTSFGAHWHILVGYRRPRQTEEHAGRSGMSDNVYIFQKVWSGRVMDKRTAWELLCLVDQIHNWATTEFRHFVIDHLRPWHSFCQQNYLWNWDSVYDTNRQRKRKRDCAENETLALPRWVEDLSEQNIGKPLRRRIELLARESLRKAIQDQRNKKGKHKMEITEEQHLNWMCQIGECAKVRRAMRADLAGDHLRNVHDASEEKCMEMSRCLQEISDHGEGGVILGNDRIYWRP